VLLLLPLTLIAARLPSLLGEVCKDGGSSAVAASRAKPCTEAAKPVAPPGSGDVTPLLLLLDIPMDSTIANKTAPGSDIITTGAAAAALAVSGVSTLKAFGVEGLRTTKSTTVLWPCAHQHAKSARASLATSSTCGGGKKCGAAVEEGEGVTAASVARSFSTARRQPLLSSTAAGAGAPNGHAVRTRSLPPPLLLLLLVLLVLVLVLLVLLPLLLLRDLALLVAANATPLPNAAQPRSTRACSSATAADPLNSMLEEGNSGKEKAATASVAVAVSLLA
jgi:hypothetical protein